MVQGWGAGNRLLRQGDFLRRRERRGSSSAGMEGLVGVDGIELGVAESVLARDGWVISEVDIAGTSLTVAAGGVEPNDVAARCLIVQVVGRDPAR